MQNSEEKTLKEKIRDGIYKFFGGRSTFLKNLDLYNLASNDVLIRGNTTRFEPLKLDKYIQDTKRGNAYWVNYSNGKYSQYKPVIIISEKIDEKGFLCVPCSTFENSEISFKCNGYKLYAKNEIEFIPENVIKRFLGIVDYEDLDVIRQAIKTKYLNLYKKDQFIESDYAINKEMQYSKLKLRHIESLLTYPTEEELMEMVNRKIQYLKYLEEEKHGKPINFIYKNGKVDYKYEKSCDHNGFLNFKITLNPGQHDFENHIYEMVFIFSNINVRCRCPEYYGTEKRVIDETLRKYWNELMFSKPGNEEYYKVLASKIVTVGHKLYKKETDDYDETILLKFTKNMQKKFKLYKLKYNGDMETAVLYGNKEFNLDLVERIFPEEKNEKEENEDNE